jgi:hypothetical protein
MHGEPSYSYPLVVSTEFCPRGPQALRVLRGGEEREEKFRVRKSENDC